MAGLDAGRYTFPLDAPAHFESIEPLAQRLYDKMEHQDLSGDRWEDLDDDERWSYRVLVEHLLLTDDLVVAALNAMAPPPPDTQARRA